MPKRSFIKDSFSIFFTKIIVVVLSVAGVIILARGLGPENRGLLAALLIYPQLLIALTEGGMRQAATFYLGKKLAPEGEILAALILYVAIAGLLGYGLVLSLLSLVGNESFSFSMMLIAAAIIPTSLTVNTFRGYFLGKQEIARFNKSTWMERCLYIGLLLTLYLTETLSVITAVAATTAAAAFNAIQAWRYVKEINTAVLQLKLSVIWRMLKIGLVYAFALFLIIANYKINILLLELLSTPSEVGYYAVSVQVAELMWQLPGAIMLVLMSRSANNQDHTNAWPEKVALVCRLMIFTTIVSAIPLALVVKYGMVLALGVDYLPTINIIFILLVSTVFMVPFKSLNADLAGEGRPIISICILLPAVILNIVLNYYLIPSYGALGAATATLFSYALCGVLICIIYSSKKRIPIASLVIPRQTDFAHVLQKLRGCLRK
jgi:O-antigen/teichoic acid export membrane protein